MKKDFDKDLRPVLRTVRSEAPLWSNSYLELRELNTRFMHRNDRKIIGHATTYGVYWNMKVIHIMYDQVIT